MQTQDEYTAKRAQVRTLCRGAYDLQKLRIMLGQRIAANFHARLGRDPNESEDELDAVASKLLDDLRQEFNRLTDGIVGLPRQKTFKGNEIISDYAELIMVAAYVEQLEIEKKAFNRLPKILSEFPIYTKFLETVNGCGPMMSAVIISEFDIRKARYPSSMWRYAGLDVGPDGRGRSRRKEHLVDREYTDGNGEVKTKKSITFNPWLKTKLIGVLGSSFLRMQGPYSTIYYDYKHRLESDPAKEEWTKAHRHEAAVRYMIKQFLRDLYVEWRPLEGLPVAPSYQEAKLGHQHGGQAA